MYKDYCVQMQGPQSMEQLDRAVQQIAQEKQCKTRQLIDKIEFEVQEQEQFLKKQHDLLKQSLKGFKEILSRIVVLRNVAKMLKIDTEMASALSYLDIEATGNSKLEQRLLD